MTKSINHTFFYAHPPQAVWAYLTEAELMKQWLMPNDFLPIVGHDFRFTINPMPALDFDGIVYCKVLEIVPQKKLCYSWKCGPGDGEINVDSIVEWVLSPKDNGTEVVLKHSGFKELINVNMFTAMNDGWLKNMQKIANLLMA